MIFYGVRESIVYVFADLLVIIYKLYVPNSYDIVGPMKTTLLITLHEHIILLLFKLYFVTIPNII